MNFGVKLRDNQVQYGFTIGTLPTGNYLTLSGDLYFHVGGNSKHTDLQPLYIKTGLMYNNESSPSYKHKSVLLNLRIGREFNFTTRFGCNIDAGANIYLSTKSEDKIRNQTFSSNKTVVLPGGSFNLFYRF